MSQPVAAPAKLKKKKAGKAAKTNLPDEDIDALLAELDGPKADDEPLRTVSGGRLMPYHDLFLLFMLNGPRLHLLFSS